MTKITYGSFSLHKANILEYVKYAQSHKNFYRQSKWHNPYTDGVINSFIYFLSTNDFNYDKNDKEIYGAIESLIREYGCDTSGVYSKESKQALKNIYAYQGLDVQKAILQNHQPQTDWKETLTATKNVFSSLKNNLFLSTKSFWKKGKYFIISTGLVGLGLFGLKTSNGISSKKTTINKKEIKVQPQQTSHHFKTFDFASQQTKLPDSMLTLKIKTNEQPKAMQNKETNKKEIIAKPQNIATQTSKLIQSTPSASKKDSLYNNYYDTSLEILLGKTKRDALYAQIQKQLKNGIFKAEQGISFRRIAHSLTMSNVYEGKSIIQKAVYSQQKLTPAEQAAFTGHILEIGARGEKLQKKFMEQKKFSSVHQSKTPSSRYSKASKKLQYQHVKNLQQLRALHNR